MVEEDNLDKGIKELPIWSCDSCGTQIYPDQGHGTTFDIENEEITIKCIDCTGIRDENKEINPEEAAFFSLIDELLRESEEDDDDNDYFNIRDWR